ncbi:MAG TPA: PQQ-dependent sugar dehydrogenase [Segeticoccus sp.]|nr:PQQ-dependent sugar dehydrogenase [Segeticoccus sp.]
MRRTPAAAVAAVVLVAALAACTGGPQARPGEEPTGTSPSGSVQATPYTSPSAVPGPTTVAQRLDVPWGIDFLPDGSALVTLRDRAEVLRVPPDGSAGPVSLGTVPGVHPDGEGGLLGIAVSPHFRNDHRVFVYLTAQSDNRVLRMTLRGGRLQPDEVVLDGIPKSAIHNGGRIRFGPDGYLYVGTGDGGDGSHSQDRDSLGGKILRIDQDGEAPEGNPFGDSPVWTYGHRNVQGLAWDPAGRMYASEFGQNTWDELNRIVKGHNYGWPVVEGRSDRSEFTNPLVQWHTDEASPSGIAIGSDDVVWMAALRGQSLWRIPLHDGRAGETRRLLEGTFGRLRAVRHAPDDRLWVLTSNTFRGDPGPDDDRILVYPPSGPTS